METKRFILVLALSMVSMLLWQAWQEDYGKPPPPSTTTAAEQKETQTQVQTKEVPVTTSLAPPSEQSTPAIQSAVTQTKGSPIIVNMTGGLQEQVTNGEEWFGWGIQPSSKSVIGSLQVPYIYEDRINQQDFEKMLTKALKLPKKRYEIMATAGRQHVLDNYNFEAYEKSWVEIMDKFIEKNGSWETRKNYESWHFMEVA